MNFTNALQMIARFEKTLSHPTAPLSAANVAGLMRDYVTPLLRELIARCAETADAALSANEMAQIAFATSRQTLAGEIFEDLGETTSALREEVEKLALDADHPIRGLLDRIDGNLSTYLDHIYEEEGDEEETPADPVVEVEAEAVIVEPNGET